MVGRKMVVPRDFAWLSEKVEERTQQRVSASTLRRFWGYVSEGVSASKFTKNVLANFLGYADFEEFGLSQGTGNGRARWLSARKSHAMIFMRDRCLNFPGCPTEPASSGIRETEVSRWYHQKIPDWRKMIPLNAIILLTRNLLIFMAGNMEIGSRSLMP